MTDLSLVSAETDGAEQGLGARRPLLLAGGAVGALGLALAGVLLLGGSEDDELAAPITPPRAAAVGAAADAPALGARLPVPFDEDLGRDPFRALYVQPAAATTRTDDPTLPSGGASGAGGGGATGSGTDATSGTGGTSGTGATSGGTGSTGTPATGSTESTGSTGGASGSGSGPRPSAQPSPSTAPPAPATPPTAAESTLVLRSVSGADDDLTAVFTIDGDRTTARVGATFGPTGHLRLVSLQEGPADEEWTAVLQVGDGEPFDVTTGQRVSVR